MVQEETKTYWSVSFLPLCMPLFYSWNWRLFSLLQLPFGVVGDKGHALLRWVTLSLTMVSITQMWPSSLLQTQRLHKWAVRCSSSFPAETLETEQPDTAGWLPGQNWLCQVSREQSGHRFGHAHPRSAGNKRE